MGSLDSVFWIWKVDVAAMSVMASHEVLNIKATGTMKTGTWLPLDEGSSLPLNWTPIWTPKPSHGRQVVEVDLRWY